MPHAKSVLIFLAIVLIAGFGGWYVSTYKKLPEIRPEDFVVPKRPIGGERDERGCLAPAGYSWQDELEICARSWEIDTEDKRQAADIAAEYLKQSVDSYGLTVVEIMPISCVGCFIVKFSDSDYQSYSIELGNWQVIYGNF